MAGCWWIRPCDAEAEGAIQLYNSDGSIAEMSGNGTRCAAAFLIRHGLAAGVVRVRTGAGIKTLRLLKRGGLAFEFEMNMGRPEITAEHFQLALCRRGRAMSPCSGSAIRNAPSRWSISISTGAPWARRSNAIRTFPNRTNVSFVKPVDEHTIDVRFWERGAGETMSSGTGSTGAAAMAVARGMVQSPVRVLTPAGPHRPALRRRHLPDRSGRNRRRRRVLLGVAGGSVLGSLCAAASKRLGGFASRITTGTHWKARATVFVLVFSLFRAFPNYNFLRAPGVADTWEHAAVKAANPAADMARLFPDTVARSEAHLPAHGSADRPRFPPRYGRATGASLLSAECCCFSAC